MQLVRDQPIAAAFGQLGIDRQGQGDDADLSIAGLHELRGVGDVLAIDQLGLYLVPQAGGAQGFLGALAVGRVLGVGDSNAGDLGVGQAGQRHLAGIHARAPQHDAAEGVGLDLGGGEALLGQLTRECNIGREIEVVGRALLNLGVELAG